MISRLKIIKTVFVYIAKAILKVFCAYRDSRFVATNCCLCYGWKTGDLFFDPEQDICRLFTTYGN